MTFYNYKRTFINYPQPMKKHLFILLLSLTFFSVNAQRQFYEMRIYEMKHGSPAAGLHDYLQKSLMPALKKQGINNIGVFEEYGQSTPAKIYLLIPYGDMTAYQKVNDALKKDAVYQSTSKDYNAITPEKAPYSRYSTSFYTAFEGLSKMVKPASGAGLFELRTYEGYSEDAFTRKVKMFNDGEMDIFNKTGLHAVFFGEKIAGPDMPCLTYMLAFKDMEERDANWKKFVDSPEWKSMSAMPEYANTVSNITRIFLKPLKYSSL